MARKKVTVAWIANGSARKASLRKRRAGLVKKVSELSTLCDVDAFVIIYSPDEREPMVWPSCWKVKEMMTRFHGMPKMEQTKKMMNQETYLNERVSKVQEKLKKHEKKHKEMMVSNLMHYIYECNGLDGLSAADLHSLLWFVEEKRMEINRRIEYFQQPNCFLLHVLSPHSAPTHAPNIRDSIDVSVCDTHEKAPVESDSCDQWFIDKMNNPENIVGSSGNHLGLAGHAKYEAYIGGGTETIVGALSSDIPSVQGSDNGNYIS